MGPSHPIDPVPPASENQSSSERALLEVVLSSPTGLDVALARDNTDHLVCSVALQGLVIAMVYG